MKTKIKILFFILATGLIFSTSCKKYPEGPSLSLRTKTQRLTGTWTVEKVLVNGNEATLNDYYKSIVVDITKDGKFTYTYTFLTLPGKIEGEWKFNDDKSKLMMKENNSSTWDESEILKLTNSEVWLKEVDGSITTETHYKAK